MFSKLLYLGNLIAFGYANAILVDDISDSLNALENLEMALERHATIVNTEDLVALSL